MTGSTPRQSEPRVESYRTWFYGGPLDGEILMLAVLKGGEPPESLTAWRHRHAPRIVEIGSPHPHGGPLARWGQGESWHGERQADLWEPFRYEHKGPHEFVYVGPERSL